MDHATHLWAWWLSRWSAVTPVCTRPGWGRFVPWVTGMVRGWAAHPLTQILTALGRESRWRALEHVAADGAWAREAVERHLRRLIAQQQPARWGRYPPVAVDDTTRHRTSQQGWGTCTVHEARARRPNRAETVRAHHGVVMGPLLPSPPWTSLPHAARLYCRPTHWPAGDPVRTKTALAVERLRQAAAESAAPILGVCDGA
jgi:hypothetical protein